MPCLRRIDGPTEDCPIATALRRLSHVAILARLVEGPRIVPSPRSIKEDPVTTVEDREFLPAMTRPALLRFYDPVSRLLGARDVQWQLVAQAGIEPGATVVEIGCGTGNVLLLAARVVPDATVIGLDPDADALALADRKLRRAGFTVQLDRGYADRLPYADASV